MHQLTGDESQKRIPCCFQTAAQCRRLGWACAFLLAALLSGGQALAKDAAPRICAGVLLEEPARTLLIRLDTTGRRLADEVRITFNDGALAAATELRTVGWTQRRKGKRLILTADSATSSSVHLRLRLPDGATPPSLSLQVRSRGKRLAALPLSVPRPLPRLASELLALPALLAAGDRLELRPLASDPCWAPGEGAGYWSVADVPATWDAADPTRLRLTLPAELDPRAPIEVAYHLASGERTVSGSFAVDDGTVRVMPPLQEEGAIPLSACGPFSGTSEPLCVCGWFPDAASRRGVRVDGRTLEPIAASSRALCYRLDPGRHRFDLAATPGAGPLAVELESLSIRQRPGSVPVGQTVPVVWTVRGSRQPVELWVSNGSPGTVRFAGSQVQKIWTCGGKVNTAQIQVAGLALGDARLNVRIGTPADGVTASTRILGRFAVEVLEDARQRFRQQVAGRPRRPGRDLPWLDERIRQLRQELLRQLRYPELASLHDYREDFFEELLAELHGEVAAGMWPRRQAPLRQALRRGDDVDFRLASGEVGLEPSSERVEGVIARIFDFFDSLLEAGRPDAPMVRDIQVRSAQRKESIYFGLYPKSYPTDTRGFGTTDLPIENLFLGKYIWEASLHKGSDVGRISKGELNLLRSEASILCCEALPRYITCKWKSETQDDCSFK